MDFLEYPDVFKEDRGAMTSGRLKMTNQAVVFKNSKTGKVEQVQGPDIESIDWQRLGAGYGLRIMMKNGTMYRFGGFQDDEQDRLAKFFKHHFEMSLGTRDLCLKGWNWGTARFEGSVLSFDIDSKSSAYEIPLGNVSHCTTAKNEVTLEFHQNDDAAVSLMELRFHVPTDPNSDTDPIQAFRNNVLSKANIIQATGESMVTFKELQCLTPRGRYDIKIFPSFIQLHGKTFDYKIPLTTVLRLFLLPHKDTRQVFFVLSLDPPIKQGQTRYHFLILLFNKEEETSIELTMSEEDIRDKFEDKIQKNMSGPTFEVISRVMKAVVQRKITVPGNFTGHGGTNCITCSYRAGNGLLYPLERGFIYIHKPPVHLRFDEIACVNFARSGGSTRSFDFEVEAKSGLVHTFSSIEKEEYGRLFDYVSDKKLRIKNRGSLGNTTKEKPNYNDDDLVDSDAEDAPDAYLARVKDEGRQRDEGDSDESSDESFNPGESGSEVAEEFDSNVSDSSDSEEGGEKEAGGDGEEKPKKEKKSKSAKTVREPGMGPPRRRKPKKERDENKPKRAPSAYFLWLAENREQIKRDNPGFGITDITKRAGELWKTVTDRSKWEEAAAKAAAEYKEAMAAYNATRGKKAGSSGDEKEEEGGEEKKKKAPRKRKEAGGEDDAKSAKKEAKKTPKPAAKQTSSPSKASGGGSFKSKEFIESSGSSSDEEVKKEDKKAKSPSPQHSSPARSSPARSSPGKSPAKSSIKSDDEEASASTPESSGDEDMSGSGSD
uniref:FACT complex subunit SSRP1 n=1 Tax=Ixodes ricinus TaxID=34613 RepID=V5IJS3_IXORI